MISLVKDLSLTQQIVLYICPLSKFSSPGNKRLTSIRSLSGVRRGYRFLDVMNANVIQEWTPCEEEEFKGLFVESPNENPSEKMEVYAKRFPAKTMQQLRGQDHFDALGDMLCCKIDVEPSINDATSDWYKHLGGERHDSVLEPSVEISLNQPSKQFVVEVAGDQAAVQKPRPHRKSTIKKRRVWSSDEHRQFLYGVQCFGRGEWKAISTYYVPSRTPAQLASHAQKYFQRIEKDDLFDKRCSINGTKLVCHDRNNTKLSGIELERVKPTESSIPQPVPAEDMNFLDDLTFLDDMNFPDGLVEGMPTSVQTSNSATNVASQMPLNNGTLGSLQLEALSTCPTKVQGSVLLDQTGAHSAETRTGPFYRQSFSMANQIHKDNIVLPSACTAQTPQQVLLYRRGGYNPTYFRSVMAPSNLYNVHPTMPPRHSEAW